MKTARSVAAMIVVAALAVFVYDYYKRVDRRNAGDEAALIREQTQVLQRQAAQVNEQLRSANEEAAALRSEVAGQRREVAGQRREEDERRTQQLAAGFLAEGLQMAASIKTAVAESYQTHLQWPASNREAGLPEAAQLSARSLQRVQVLRNGVISLTYDEKSGVAGGVIKLIPDVGAGGGPVSWRCVTQSYENIAAVIPQCAYTAPSPKASPP